MRTRSRITRFWALFLIFSFGTTCVASAQGISQDPVKFYVGFALAYNTIGGDFDGENLLMSPEEVIVVPKVDGNYGFEISLGGRLPAGALELSYLRSSHDISWAEEKSTADYNMVSVDLEAYFMHDKPIQPSLLLGVSFPWLVAKEASATATSVGDASFRGIGLNLGGGVSYYIHPRLSINAEGILRLTMYTAASGVTGESRSIEDSLWGTGLTFSVGMKIAFFQLAR